MTTPPITADLSQPGTQAPAPVPAGPHARLLQMIQGLSVGVGALAHSATTGGREGGPEEVQAYQAEQQKEQLRAQESQQSAQRAQREQQESDLRNQVLQANLKVSQMQYQHAIMRFPNEQQEDQIRLQNATVKEFVEEKQTGESMGYDMADPVQAAEAKQRMGVGSAVQQPGTISIPFSSGQSTDEVMKTMTAAIPDGKHLIDYTILPTYTDEKHGTGGNITMVPSNSPSMKMPATPRQIASAEAESTGILIKAKAEGLEDNDQFKAFSGKFETLKKVIANGGKPSSGQLFDLHTSVVGPLAKLYADQKDANVAKRERESAEAATPDAQVALTRRKAQAEQAVKDGDPNAAADLLGKGLVAPSELISARNPAFAQKALSAAATKYPEFNAQKAEADFHIAKSEDNTKFFGAVNSLLGKGGVGGNLDLLADKYKTLKNGDIPLFNKMADYTKAAAGDPALSGFVQAVIGVADDYAKVMGGGVGTDAARLQLLQAFSNAKNPAQMRNSIRTAKQALSSQAEARIGNNPVLKQMYGGATMPPAPKDATGIAPGSDGKDHYHDAKGQDLGIAP